MKGETVLGAFVWFTVVAAAQQQRFDGKSWWRHIEVLAADNMEGRDTGAPGLERAEAYVVDQLKRIGLAPAGTSGYFQPIKFESRQVVQAEPSAALVRGDNVVPLALGEDAVIAENIPNVAPRLDAPLVFLGYGLTIPEKNYDDLAGHDLRGKVAVTIGGLPEGITGLVAAHHTALRERWQQFRNAGLIGWIVIPTADSAWRSIAEYWAEPIKHLAGGEFDDTKGAQISMVFNPAHADKLFQNTGHTSAELFALAKAHRPLPRFELPATLRAQMRTLKKPFKSANVVAKLEGEAIPSLRMNT